MSASEIVNKVSVLSPDRWNYAQVLPACNTRYCADKRDDGVGYLPSRQVGGNYVETALGVLPSSAFEYLCSSLSLFNEVPHECV